MSEKIILSDSINKKRKELSFNQKQVLETAWQEGMTSSGAACLPVIKDVSTKLELSEQQVKYWIGNRNSKGRYQKKSKSYERGPTAYTMFASTKGRGNLSKEEYFKNISLEWNSLSQGEKSAYKKQAQEIKRDPLKMTDRNSIIKDQMNKIKNAVLILDKIDYAVGGFGLDKQNPTDDKKSCRFFTTGAEKYFTAELFERYQQMFQTSDVVEEESKDLKKDLKFRLRRHFYECWAKSTGLSTPIPYQAIKQGAVIVRVKGFPNDVTFKDPAYYGKTNLKRLLRLPISFEIINKERETVVENEVTQSEENLHIEKEVAVDNCTALQQIALGLGEEHQVEKAELLEHEHRENDAANDINSLIKRLETTEEGNKKRKRTKSKYTQKKRVRHQNKQLYEVQEVIKRKGNEVYLKWADGSTSWVPKTDLVVNDK